MKYFIFTVLILISGLPVMAQNTFELEPSQSMLMTGKGPGQDAVNNPYTGQDCYAIVDNIGDKAFSVRLQSEGKIIEIILIDPQTSKKIELLNGYELYLDTDYVTKARVQFEGRNNQKLKKSSN
jgi:hypothetical protein